MAFKVQYKNRDLWCDTLDEVDEALARLEGKPEASHRLPNEIPEGVSPFESPDHPPDIKGFARAAKEKSKNLLRELAVGGPLSREELRDRLNLKDYIALGSQIGGLKNTAKKFGIELEQIVRKYEDPRTETPTYSIPDGVLEELKEGLGL